MTVYCNCSSFDDQEVFLVMILRVRIEIISWNILIPIHFANKFVSVGLSKVCFSSAFYRATCNLKKTIFGLPYLVCLIFLSSAVDAVKICYNRVREKNEKDGKKEATHSLTS